MSCMLSSRCAYIDLNSLSTALSALCARHSALCTGHINLAIAKQFRSITSILEAVQHSGAAFDFNPAINMPLVPPRLATVQWHPSNSNSHDCLLWSGSETGTGTGLGPGLDSSSLA